MAGVTMNSLLRYSANPAGFKVPAEKSAPTAEKAPASPKDLAVPIGPGDMYRKASSSFCANTVEPTQSIARVNPMAFRLKFMDIVGYRGLELPPPLLLGRLLPPLDGLGAENVGVGLEGADS